MKFKCKLKIIIWELNMTQGEFAERVGISNSALSLIVNNKSLPEFENTYKICKFLKMKMDDIWVELDE